MSTPRFDTVPGISPLFLSDTDPSIEIIDPDGTPNRVIEAAVGFTVRVTWELKGLIAPLIANTWHARLFAQALGTAGLTGKLVDTTAVSAAPIGGGGVRFSALLPVSSAQTAAMHDAEGDGVYQLVVVVSHVNSMHHRDTMAGFSTTVRIDVRQP
ncbi:MAG: hypothetical protein ABI317_14225 [Gaiellales bacterium]